MCPSGLESGLFGVQGKHTQGVGLSTNRVLNLCVAPNSVLGRCHDPDVQIRGPCPPREGHDHLAVLHGLGHDALHIGGFANTLPEGRGSGFSLRTEGSGLDSLHWFASLH